jgi:hypothetical protein
MSLNPFGAADIREGGRGIMLKSPDKTGGPLRRKFRTQKGGFRDLGTRP